MVSVEQLGDIVVANRELGLKLVVLVPSGVVLARLVEFLVIVPYLCGLNVDVSIEVVF